MTIHKTAIIEGDVNIGENVTIGPYAFISGKINIGANSMIGPYVQIEGSINIGEGNQIFHSAYIGAPPQDEGYEGTETYVEIGKNNIIREFVQIHRGTKEGSVTRLGSDCFLMGGVHIAHNVKIGNSVIMANYTALAGYVEIDDYSFVSGLSGFHQFTRIGKYAMIGGCSRISKDCPPFMIVEGNPARIAGINVVGLRRRNFSSERRRAIKEAYRILFRSGKNMTQALNDLKSDEGNEDINELIRFIESSTRGVTR
ncbi:MAG: acyl-ACP--UDP-N-acetylglucosamine O-acyltransferase [Spirochaetota bacterium]|nr:acyl-ACP--UDP-N-acetylglucosamine O-acyltransferase [Spirochaetota bacterium]